MEQRKPEGQMDLSDVLRVIRRRKLVILTTFVVGMFAGYLMVKDKQPVYEAQASIEIKRETTFREMYSLVATRGRMATETTIITSFPVLARVARRLGLVPEEMTEDQILLNEDYVRMVRGLQGDVRAQVREETTILDIWARAADPVAARELAQAVAEEYRDYSRDATEAKHQEAGKFVETQRGTLIDSLSRAEQAMMRFKEENNIVDLPLETQLYLQRFEALMEERAVLETKLRNMEAFLDRLRSPSMQQGDAVSPFNEHEVGNAFNNVYVKWTEVAADQRIMATTFTSQHPAMREVEFQLETLSQDLIRQGGRIRDQWTAQLEEIYRKVIELDEKHRAALKHQVEISRMTRGIEIVQRILESLEEKYQELRLQATVRGEDIRIVQPAITPRDPIVQRSWGAMLVVVVLMLVLGVGLAFVQESLDFSLVTIEEVEKYLGLPVLGVIPHHELTDIQAELAPSLKEAVDGLGEEVLRLVTHLQPKSVMAESYRALRMHLSKGGEKGKAYAVTSAMPQEGKSTTILNLALSFAQGGTRTLVIEGNTRRPVYRNVLKMPSQPGLVELVHGTAPLQDVIRDVTDLMLSEFSLDFLKLTPGFENLWVIPAGATPLNPPDVLGTFVRSGVLDELRTKFDMILVDCPPILPVSDATIIAPATDGVVLVYRWGKTSRQLVRRAVEGIEKVGSKAVGVVLNDVDFRIGGLYPAYRYRLGRGTYSYVYGGKPQKVSTGLAGTVKRLKDYIRAARDRAQLRS
ncbi:MAG: polysaccharide biosynthesis tyrosine autokinase [Nitrospirae bacterium]|nr:polysaccharide biosynthesis tyrosine autokinase [Nitrospirota bacterium]